MSTISAKSDAGALNTIALSLAIIAFVCQLLVYTVQSWQSSEQLRRSEELHASTVGLISDARARIENTESMVQTQHQELLRIVAEKSERETLKASIDGLEAAGDPAKSAVEQVTSLDSSPQREERPEPRLLELLGSPPVDWPTEPEGLREGVEELKELGDYELSSFVLSISDFVSSISMDSLVGLTYNRNDIPLIEAGLLKELPARGDRRFVAPTERGKILGAIVLAPWPPPASLGLDLDSTWELREAIKPNPQSSLNSTRRIVEEIREQVGATLR